MNSDDSFGFNGDGQASALGGGGGGRASDILKVYLFCWSFLSGAGCAMR